MERGDVLLVDPDPQSARFSGYDLLPHDDCHHQMSKLVNIDGRFYDLKITPTGDELSLTPCALPVGRVTNPNQGFRALLYGDKGTVAVGGGKSSSAAVPSGRWKLLAYTIDRTGLPEPLPKEPPAEKPKKEVAGDAKKAKKEGGSLLEALARILSGAAESVVPAAPTAFGMPRSTLVSAEATARCKPIEVRAGQTVPLPFGPPYKPVVKVQFFNPGKESREAHLALELIGSAGEVCTDLMLDGSRPASPDFTIRAAKGDVVEHGSFKYG
jgi:hypothetical protein